MNQAQVRCPNCGASEVAGARFCGHCGAVLGEGAGTNARELVAELLRRPLLAALLGGLGLSVVVVLLLTVIGSSGSGAPPDGGGQALANDGASIDRASPTVAASEETPPASSPSAAEEQAETPEPTATTERPTATSEPPTETPVPPTSTPAPPTATSIPPTAAAAPSSLPAEKQSRLVGLSVTGGHGSSHRIGEQITLCYSSLANQYIRLLDFQPPGNLINVIREGVDDGQGECISGNVTAPAGYEVFRVEAWNSSVSAVADYAELWIQIVP
jgi:hypothetical protein